MRSVHRGYKQDLCQWVRVGAEIGPLLGLLLPSRRETHPNVAALKDHSDGAGLSNGLIEAVDLGLHQVHERCALAAHAAAAGQHCQRAAVRSKPLDDISQSTSHAIASPLCTFIGHDVQSKLSELQLAPNTRELQIADKTWRELCMWLRADLTSTDLMTLRMRDSLAAASLTAFSSSDSPSRTSMTADAVASRTTAAAAAAAVAA